MPMKSGRGLPHSGTLARCALRYDHTTAAQAFVSLAKVFRNAVAICGKFYFLFSSSRFCVT
jgi:hypothetical protein